MITPVWKAVGNSFVVSWSGLANGDVGAPVAEGDLRGAERLTIQVAGTFAKGVVHVEGSNDGQDYAVLNDPHAVPLVFAVPKIRSLVEICASMRPHCILGSEDTSLTVIMLVRKL